MAVTGQGTEARRGNALPSDGREGGTRSPGEQAHPTAQAHAGSGWVLPPELLVQFREPVRGGGA